MKNKVSKIIRKYTDQFGFISTNTYIQERSQTKSNYFNDYSFLDAYKTIITLAFPYPQKEVDYKGKGYGLMARFSYSNDYHTVIGEKLSHIIAELNGIGITGYGSVDVSKIDEKYSAYLSGLGYFGKNSILISPVYGNYMFLATIVVDTLIEEGVPSNKDCGSCTLCIDACPSNALENGFHRELCISHLSQTKKELSEVEISYFKDTIYGCDICLKVCPMNTGIDLHMIEEFEPNGIENIWLEDLLFMTKKQFQKRFGNNTSHWIGVSTMRRNAISIMSNQDLKEYLPKIKESKSVYKANLWYNKTADKIIKKLESE